MSSAAEIAEEAGVHPESAKKLPGAFLGTLFLIIVGALGGLALLGAFFLAIAGHGSQ